MSTLTIILIAAETFVLGAAAGFLLHVVLTNKRLTAKGLDPHTFWEER